MKVYPLYFAVFFIAKAATAVWPQEDPSIKDVARQGHPHKKREDFARYPKRVIDLKGRFYHASPSNEVHLNKVPLRPISGRLRHSSRKRKFSPSVEGLMDILEPQRPEENASTVKEETKEPSTADVKGGFEPERPGVASTTGEPALNEDQDLDSDDESPNRVFPHVHSRLSKTNDGSVSSCETCCGDCSDCPPSVETMFICPKCHTHYIIRLNMKESCCGNTERKAVRKEHKHQRNDDRGKREGGKGKKVKKICTCPGPCDCPKPCTCEGPCTCEPPPNVPNCQHPECPNAIETMFKCHRCRTHYIIRLNFKEPLVLKGRGRAYNEKKRNEGTINDSAKSFRPTADEFLRYKPLKKTVKTSDGDGDVEEPKSAKSLRFSVNGLKRFKPLKKVVPTAEETAEENGNEEIKQNSAKSFKFSGDGLKHFKPIKKVVQIEETSDNKDGEKTNINSGQLTIDGIKHYKPMKKVAVATEEPTEFNTQASDKKRLDSVEIAQDAKHSDKVEQSKSKTGFTEEEPTSSPVAASQLNPTIRHRTSNHRATCGGCPDCPNSVETIFVCPKCRTHYIVRINIRESKCCGNPAPSCCPGASAAFADHLDRLESRIRKQKISRHSQLGQLEKMHKLYPLQD
ncbi:hypothetical protein GE061_007219 [Apolygus lucorum]|uniref:Uncharacterized protein n=1 Tax=Apolygus lucorum TaxID=248454 RepID=A0A8S9WSI9_APOLU|nr:hypothetical protein GE061_007219 [Apolygus lucorum]